MKILKIQNLKASSPLSKTIDVMVEIEGLGLVPFTASPDDVEKHGRDMYAACLRGDHGVVLPYVAPVKPTLPV